MNKKFTFFWHSPSPFSQWHPSVFTVKNITFTSAEQFMMFCKAKLFKDETVAEQIIDLSNEYNHKKDRQCVLGMFLNGDVSKYQILNKLKTRYKKKPL